LRERKTVKKSVRESGAWTLVEEKEEMSPSATCSSAESYLTKSQKVTRRGGGGINEST